jgi:chain length determinant protein (polysaccharide antigen chain regulator)
MSSDPQQQPNMYQPLPDDEIDLLDLLRVLIRRWKMIALVTVVVTALAVTYALLAPRVYKTEAILRPSTPADVQQLDVKGVYTHDLNMIHAFFKQNLQSVVVKKAVFEEMDLLNVFSPERDQQENVNTVFDEYVESISIIFPEAKKGEEVFMTSTLAMEGEDPVLIADIVNRLVEEARRVTTSELILNVQANVRARIRDLTTELQLLREKTTKQRLDEVERLETADDLQKKNITDKIATLRDFAKQRRLDRIEKLREAAGIAHSLGIKDPIAYKLKKIGEASPSSSQIMTDLTAPAPQLYTLGYEAVEAEIASLSSRETDDPFIPELRGLQEQLAILAHNRKAEQLKSRKNDDPFIASLREKENELVYLQSIHIDPQTVVSARLDQPAVPPEDAIKPKRRLVVALGAVVGLMGGIFLAFFLNFIESSKGKLTRLETGENHDNGSEC